MNNIGGFGLVVTLVAVPTFPTGLTITQFADDADPFEVEDLTIADAASGLNGDLVVWSKAAPVTVTLNIIPGSDDDKNLSMLANLNRVGAFKVSTKDVVSLIGTYPNGTKKAFINGAMVVGSPSPSVSSSGRMKTRKYTFKFENLA